MTFKHITFGESPIMRSLEKVAMERGMFEPEPVVKEASAGESYEPTDDLLGDMLHLTNGLRQRGFVAEANALEDKIFTHKQAAKDAKKVVKDEGEKMLEDAHPEGDVEVAPSKGGYGKMLTQKTTQDEIKRIINKMPTGKYAHKMAQFDPARSAAAQQIGVKMAVAFGNAMVAPLGTVGVDAGDADDIADAVKAHLGRILITDLKDYPTNSMTVVADKFITLLSTEAQGWAVKMKEDMDRIPDYDMDEGLKIVAGQIFAKATGQMQSEYGQEGTYGSVVENIVKAAEDALDINKIAQDWLRHATYPANIAHIEGLRDLAKDEINRIQMLPLLERPRVYFDGKVGLDGEQATRLFVTRLLPLYIKKNSEGIDIERYHWAFINHLKANVKIINKRIPYTLGFVLHMDLETMFANAKASVTAPSTKPKVPGITKRRLHEVVIKKLGDMAKALEEFSDNVEKTEESRTRAGWTASQYRYMVAILGELSDPMTYQTVKDAFMGMVEAQEGFEDQPATVGAPELSKYRGANTLTELRIYIEKVVAGVGRFIRSKAYDIKKGSDHNLDILKLGQMEDEPEEEKDEPTPTVTGVGYNTIKRMQQALQTLATEINKSDPKRAIINNVGPKGPDGDWGSNTQTALAEAEKLRRQYQDIPGSIVSSQAQKSYAKSNLAILQTLTNKVKEGAGIGYRGTGQSLGKYKRPFGKELVEITTGDVSSLASFQRFLENTDIDLELGGPPIITPEQSKAEKEEEIPLPPKPKLKTPIDRGFADSETYANYRLQELIRIGQAAPATVKQKLKYTETGVIDPWADEAKKPKKPKKPTEMIPGITLSKWRKAFSHFKQEARSVYDVPGKNRGNALTLWWQLDARQKEIEALADEQKTAPEQVVNTGVRPGAGVPYTAVPGMPGWVIVYDRYGTRRRMEEGQQIPRGYTYQLVGPSALRPPITGNILDLRRPEFGMDPKFQVILEWRDFDGTHGSNIASKYFPGAEVLNYREAEALYTINNNLRILRWHPGSNTHRVEDKRTGKLFFLSKENPPGYRDHMKLQAGDERDRGLAFLVIARKALGRAFRRWMEGIPEAELARVYTPVNRQVSRWIQMFKIKESQLRGS